MKLLLVLALVAMVAADVSELGQPPTDYLPPAEGAIEESPAFVPDVPNNEYVPPAADEPAPAHTLEEDGYRYKTVRRIKYRHRV